MPVRLAFAVYWVIINFITWHAWVDDKRRAVRRDRRTPENTLLWLCLLGGWPAGLLAARQFRHKTAKSAFLSKVYALTALNIAVCAAILVLLQP